MCKAFICIVFLVLFFSAFTGIAQTSTPRYIVMTSATGGYYEYLPENYDSTGTAKYPFILYIHGNSERGAGDSLGLLEIIGGGLPKVMSEPDFPASFTVNNQVHRFIVISPQFRPRPTVLDVDSVINYVVQNYPVDKHRIYVTGFSMGGASCWDYAGASSTFANKLAAIVPISGSGTPDSVKTRIIAAANLPVWATHNEGDLSVPVSTTDTYIDLINLPPAPTPLAKKTIFASSSHNAWNKTYNPDFREDSLNVFEWMLQYQRLPTPVAPPMPKIIKVNIYGGSAAYSDVEWNNWNVVNSLASGPLNFSDYTTSGVSAVLSQSNGVLDNGTTYGGGVAPAQVLRHTSSSAVQRSLTINGLLPEKKYALELYASRNSTSVNATVFSVTGLYQTVTTNKNLTQKAMFNGLMPTAAGKLTVNISNTAAYNYINGFIIKEEPEGTNSLPVANAGPDQSTTLPADSIILSGTATDDDSTLRFAWTKLSGPSATVFSNDTAAITTITHLKEGTYIFRLIVTDNDSAIAFDDVRVVVQAAPPPPGTRFVQVNIFGGINPYADTAWNNWNVSNSLSSHFLRYADTAISTVTATLSRSNGVSDNGAAYGGGMAPAQVLRYASNSTAARTLTLSGLTIGKTYRLELYGSRNSTSNYSSIYTINDVSIIILTDKNKTANATFINLQPSASGQIVIAIKSTKTYNYINGFVLTEMGEQPGVPTANAGADKEFILPQNSDTLSGTSIDAEGNMALCNWSQIAGPTQSTIISKDSLNTEITNLEEGTYTYRFTVTDSTGNTAYDDVNVLVQPAPLPVGTRLVKVNVFGGVNPYNNAEWNNWNASASLTSGFFDYSDTSGSVIKATLSRSDGISDNGATYGGTMAPPEVLRYASYSTAPRTLIISGLSPAASYSLELFSSRNNTSGYATIYTVNDSSKTVVTDKNKSNPVLFTNLTANSAKQIIVKLGATKTYNYINGFILTETVPDTTTVPADTTATTAVQQNNREVITTTKTTESIKETALKIFPNPTATYFIVKWESAYKQAQIKIVNEAGSTVEIIKINPGRTLDFGHRYKAGIYFAEFTQGTERKLIKLIKTQ